jgi:hypothetical protein
MIQRMSDQHKIQFLDNEKAPEKVSKSEAPSKKTINQLAEEQKAKKLSNKFDNQAQQVMTTKHISSARTGGVTNEGGPSTYIKSNSSNTIWNSDKTANASKELDSKTKTIQEKAQIASNRREAENKRMNDLTESLKSTLQDKASSISPAGTLSGTNYKVSKNNMSIFDNKDFMRLSEKTGGEKVSEDVKARRGQVDNSWRDGGKVVSSKDVTKNLMEGLFKKSE